MINSQILPITPQYLCYYEDEDIQVKLVQNKVKVTMTMSYKCIKAVRNPNDHKFINQGLTAQQKQRLNRKIQELYRNQLTRMSILNTQKIKKQEQLQQEKRQREFLLKQQEQAKRAEEEIKNKQKKQEQKLSKQQGINQPSKKDSANLTSRSIFDKKPQQQQQSQSSAQSHNPYLKQTNQVGYSNPFSRNQNRQKAPEQKYTGSIFSNTRSSELNPTTGISNKEASNIFMARSQPQPQASIFGDRNEQANRTSGGNRSLTKAGERKKKGKDRIS